MAAAAMAVFVDCRRWSSLTEAAVGYSANGGVINDSGS